MLYKDDVALVEKAVTLGFRDQDSANAWDRIKNELKERAQLSRNTGSPKLPTLLEAISGALGFKVTEVPGTDTAMAMKDMYDFMCRQLRAGA